MADNQKDQADQLDDLDQAIIAEINARYPDEDDAEFDASLSKRRTPFIWKLTTVLAVIACIVMALNGQLKLVNMPSMDFLKESIVLSKTPQNQVLQAAVAQITVQDARTAGQERTGTGFNIRPDGVIITNRHVVEHAKGILVALPDQPTYAAKQWYVSKDTDLAVIMLGKQKLPTVQLAGTDVQLPKGQLTIIGNPFGLSRVVVHGQALSYARVKDIKAPVFEIIAAVHPGSSGSPVFDAQQAVVAVIFATVKDAQQKEIRALAIPVAQLYAFLNEQKITLGNNS